MLVQQYRVNRTDDAAARPRRWNAILMCLYDYEPIHDRIKEREAGHDAVFFFIPVERPRTFIKKIVDMYHPHVVDKLLWSDINHAFTWLQNTCECGDRRKAKGWEARVMGDLPPLAKNRLEREEVAWEEETPSNLSKQINDFLKQTRKKKGTKMTSKDRLDRWWRDVNAAMHLINVKPTKEEGSTSLEINVAWPLSIAPTKSEIARMTTMWEDNSPPNFEIDDVSFDGEDSEVIFNVTVTAPED